jgi:NCS2 family nucleobase:cation symporter-2/xanthine permease XanP
MSAENKVRFEPHEKPSHLLAAGLGAQVTILIITGIMITPLIVSRTAGLDAGLTSWLVFAALLACGISTWLQVAKIGIIGGGFTLFVGSNVAFVSVNVAAIQHGGVALMAALVCAASVTTFIFTSKMGALRKILTPAVGGTVLMLMSLSIAPVVWKMLQKVPESFVGSPIIPMVFLATLLPIVIISLVSKKMLRLWAPLIGVVIGSLVAAQFGLVDTSKVADAPWIGLPQASWPGISLEFNEYFWTLLPTFVLITLVGCIETYADGISVQRTSYRQSKPIDFRSVQGAINADGLGSFIAGLLGTVPNTVYSMSVGVMELTGVAARRVGWWGGAFLMMLAFSPKICSIVTCMPSPVAGAYILMILVLLFGHGVRMVNEDDLTFEAGIAVCLGFWVGTGFQGGFLFNDMLPEWAKLFLSNGTTSGGITAILIMLFLSMRNQPKNKVVLPLNTASLLELRKLIQSFCKRLAWDEKAENRLMLIAEEALIFLLQNKQEAKNGDETKKIDMLHVRLTEIDHEAELEYISAPSNINAESALLSLNKVGQSNEEDQISLRLIKVMAKDVKHLQYHGTDYLLLRVDSTA